MVALAPDFLDAIALDEARADRAVCRAALQKIRGALRDVTDDGYRWKLSRQCEAYERAIVRYDRFIRDAESASA
jgi:hypothetical protein